MSPDEGARVLTSHRLRAALVAGATVGIAAAGPGMAQLSIPTPPPVQTVVPSVVASTAPAIPTPVPTLPLPTAVPTVAVPTLVPTAVPTVAVPSAVATAPLPPVLPTPVLVPTAIPTAVPTAVPTLPGELPTLPTTLPTALPALPTLPSSLPTALPDLPVDVPLPALPGLPPGTVRLPTAPDVTDVFLDLTGDGLADAKVDGSGAVRPVSRAEAQAVNDAATASGARPRAAVRSGATSRPAAGRAPTTSGRVDARGAAIGGRAAQGAAAPEDERSVAVLVAAGALALAAAAGQLQGLRAQRGS